MKMRGSPFAWKQEELAILQEHYENAGADAVIAAGVKRSRKAIKRKAYDMGLNLTTEARRRLSLAVVEKVNSRHSAPNVAASRQPFAAPDEYIQAADIFQVGYRYFKQYGWGGQHVAASI